MSEDHESGHPASRFEGPDRRLQCILSQLPVFVGVVNLEGLVTDYNVPRVERLGIAVPDIVGTPFDAACWWSSDEGSKRQIGDLLTRAVNGETVVIERPYCRSDGTEGVVELRLRPLFDADGEPKEILATGIDVTERVNERQHSQALLDELNHRVKNVLALVNSLVSLSLRDADTLESGARMVRERLAVYSRSHDLLFRDEWRGASLREVVTEALSAFPGQPVELSLDDCLLPARPALKLGLALHELGSNARQHGAWSNDCGKVTVTGRCQDDKGMHRLKIIWCETDGPIVSPVREGFGKLLIERVVAEAFDGNVTLEYPPSGLRWSLEAVLEK